VTVKFSRRTTAVAAIAGAAAFAIIATGCSAATAPAAESTKPITLTLATFNNFGYSDALLASYHKLHPNITVVQNKAATSDAAQTNMFTKLAAGSGLGDVEAVDGDWMPKLRQYSSKFVDLASADNKGRYSTWKTAGGTAGGKEIGLGTDIGPEAICYRSDLRRHAPHRRLVELLRRWRQVHRGKDGRGVVRLRGRHLPGSRQPVQELLREERRNRHRRDQPGCEEGVLLGVDREQDIVGAPA
jgi:hypothetical protein